MTTTRYTMTATAMKTWNTNVVLLWNRQIHDECTVTPSSENMFVAVMVCGRHRSLSNAFIMLFVLRRRKSCGYTECSYRVGSAFVMLRHMTAIVPTLTITITICYCCCWCCCGPDADSSLCQPGIPGTKIDTASISYYVTANDHVLSSSFISVSNQLIFFAVSI